ncbi:hypothetical protein J7I44_01780 [Frateuria sp. MAH-13]|uniref:Uncharacterized protein n=1 Tax=Frateuria flava TaxID=2821489 RepID=A0ABS4DIX4_9GAMM|nr:hypothetical protein [Frateuria flava]MBP1473009.1 hypothetical protein [Frateuria flava]
MISAATRSAAFDQVDRMRRRLTLDSAASAARIEVLPITLLQGGIHASHQRT